MSLRPPSFSNADIRLSGAMLSAIYRAMENIEVGVAVMELSGTVVYANEAFSALLPLPDGASPVGRGLEDWFPDCAAFVTPLLDSLLRGESWRRETAFLSGKSSWLDISAIPESRAGEIASKYALLLVRNADELRRAELAEHQVERNRIMMESIGAICHSIGQPATVLLSSVEMMRMNILDEKGRKEVLDLCYEAVLEIRDLLRQLNEKRQYATESYLGDAVGGQILALGEKAEAQENPPAED